MIRRRIYTFFIEMVYYSTYFTLSSQNKSLQFFLIENQIVLRVDKKRFLNKRLQFIFKCHQRNKLILKNIKQKVTQVFDLLISMLIYQLTTVTRDQSCFYFALLWQNILIETSASSFFSALVYMITDYDWCVPFVLLIVC